MCQIHPKDKTYPKEGVYTIDCKGCDKKYIGETKRQLKVPAKEHRSEAEKVSEAIVYIRDRKRQVTEWNVGLSSHRPFCKGKTIS